MPDLVSRARGKKRKALELAERLREDADEEAGVARSICSRKLGRLQQPPAQERMQELKARLQAQGVPSG